MEFYLLVNYISVLLAINFDSIQTVRLPMSGKNDHSFWLNFGGDFFPNLLELWIDRVAAVVHDVRLRTISIWPSLYDPWLDCVKSSSNYLRRHGRRSRLVFY